MLGLDCWNGTFEQVSRFRDETDVDFPLLLNGRDTAARYDLPYHSFVVVDGRGMIRYVSAGPDPQAFDLAALEEVIEDCMRDSNQTQDATWGLIKALYSRK